MVPNFSCVEMGRGGVCEEKQGDVAAFVATTLPSNHFHAKEIPTKLRLY